jgi:AraC-like DNA-binding protein
MMETLAAVLQDVRVEGSFYARSDLGAPWGLAFSAQDGACFHIVAAGTCWLCVDEDCFCLRAGDVALLPRGRTHRLGDTPDSPATPLAALPSERIGLQAVNCRFGGEGVRALLICGAVRFAGHAAHPLLALLPDVLVLRSAEEPGDQWLSATLALLGAEAHTPRPGGAAVLTRLVDILVIQTLRAWLDRVADRTSGWLGALGDPEIGQALAWIHRRAEEPWTVGSLAAAVHLSRSVFSERFTRLVGMPPRQYLAQWRMHLASSWIGEERVSLGEAACRLGYSSEAAFSRAFRRHHGLPPGAFRRGSVGSSQWGR